MTKAEIAAGRTPKNEEQTVSPSKMYTVCGFRDESGRLHVTAVFAGWIPVVNSTEPQEVGCQTMEPYCTHVRVNGNADTAAAYAIAHVEN